MRAYTANESERFTAIAFTLQYTSCFSDGHHTIALKCVIIMCVGRKKSVSLFLSIALCVTQVALLACFVAELAGQNQNLLKRPLNLLECPLKPADAPAEC